MTYVSAKLAAGAALMTLALQACNTLAYQEPQPGSVPLARVRFITTSQSLAVLRMYDDPGCLTNEVEWMRLADHWQARPQPQSLGMPLWRYNPNAAKEVHVAAGKQLNGMFFGSEVAGEASYSCATPFFFTFKGGHDYEVTYEWALARCDVVISELVPEGQSWTRVERARFDDAVDDINRGCVDQFHKTRLY